MLKEYRMLSFVERWSIAPRHNHQSVADHSFFVTLYTSQICEMLKINRQDRTLVLDAALRHDAQEIRTSDIPGPAKRDLISKDKAKEYEEVFASGMDDLYRQSMTYYRESVVYGNVYSDEFIDFPIRGIIKVADLIDEVFFLAIELQFGNNMVRDLYQKVLSRLDQAATKLAGEEFAEALLSEVGRQIARLQSEGAAIPQNDDDLK